MFIKSLLLIHSAAEVVKGKLKLLFCCQYLTLTNKNYSLSPQLVQAHYQKFSLPWAQQAQDF